MATKRKRLDTAPEEASLREMDPAPIVAELMSRFGDTYNLKRYNRSPPDRDLTPIFLDEIDAELPGGKGTNPDGPWVWCSECERPKFWHGIAITNETQDLYLIGQKCSRRYYGTEVMSAARARWKAGLDRRRAIDRFRNARATVDGVTAEISPLSKLPDLRDIDGARRALRKSMPDLMLRMRSSIALNDGQIVTSEPFKDTSGVNQLEKVRLGELLGSALLQDIGCEAQAIERLAAAASTITAVDDFNSQTSSDLNDWAKSYEEALHGLIKIWSDAATAHRFFEPTNLDRVVRFGSNMRRHYSVDRDEDGLVSNAGGRRRKVQPIPVSALPQLNACARADGRSNAVSDR